MPLQFFLLVNGGFYSPQLREDITAAIIGGLISGVQFFDRSKTLLLEQEKSLAHVFEIMLFRPIDIALSFAFSDFGFDIHHAAELVLLLKKFFSCERSFHLRLFCVSVKDGKYCCFVKIVAELSGSDGLGPIRGQIGEPAATLLDGNTTAEKLFSKIFKADCIGKCVADFLAEFVFVRFKLGLLDGQALCRQRGILVIQRELAFLLRPILTLSHPGLAAVQKINLVQSGSVAHFHDLGAEVFHGSIGAAMFHARLRIAWPIHIRHERNLSNSQGVDHDMHVNVAAAVVPIRMCAYDCLMSGKMISAKGLTQLLCSIYVQTMINSIPWIEADDIVMAFDILSFLILVVAEIGAKTGDRKIFSIAVQCGNAIILARDKPAIFIEAGLHGKLVMLKGEIRFGGGVVSVFRADMFERCQWYHRPFSSHQI